VVGAKSTSAESCKHCAAPIGDEDRALFVEEEVGRIFCSEKCIAAYFNPEIERLEKSFFKALSASDLGPTERESLAHLRWITLQEPDEVWREKTLAGDNRYTLISQFEPGSKKVWSVCICLLLRGEPSFLYLAFVTRNPEMIKQYQRGERIEWVRSSGQASAKKTEEQVNGGSDEAVSDRLGEPWTEEETFRAQMGSERRHDDIAPEKFGNYQKCIQETLEDPDELWSQEMPRDSVRIYHFIRFYSDENPTYWYVVVARETPNDEEIEILDAFPTRDVKLVNQYRRGDQEMTKETQQASSSRVVH